MHIKELGNAAPKEPFFFLKPTTSYVTSGGKVEIPKGIIVHHEGKLSDSLRYNLAAYRPMTFQS